MNNWFLVLTVLFILVSAVMVLIILVQRPQGGGLAGAFGGAGGGGTDTVFGGRVADSLSGGAGNDNIGGDFADVYLDAGDGNDSVSVSAAPSGETARLTQVTLGAGDDRLSLYDVPAGRFVADRRAARAGGQARRADPVGGGVPAVLDRQHGFLHVLGTGSQWGRAARLPRSRRERGRGERPMAVERRFSFVTNGPTRP